MILPNSLNKEVPVSLLKKMKFFQTRFQQLIEMTLLSHSVNYWLFDGTHYAGYEVELCKELIMELYRQLVTSSILRPKKSWRRC